MFTGIVEEIGTIKEIYQTADAYKLTIAAHTVLESVKIGDSISVNGVCLTVVSFNSSVFTADIMPETMKSANLIELSVGSTVNLERAMSANGRFDGHIVSGHIDGVGNIIGKKTVANAVYYDIETNDQLLDFMIEKGSVAVDGTSLTIAALTDTTFTFSLIPLTASHTVLGEKEVGDTVNIECDVFGKYVAKFFRKTTEKKLSSNITQSFLEENGFY